MLAALWLALCGISPIWAGTDAPQPRIAMIMANSEYLSSKDRLSGPFQDAAALQAALASLGFVGLDNARSPSVFSNLRADQMREKIVAFRKSLEAAGPLAVGFVYYAGHGGADEGGTDNFMLPVDVPDIATANVAQVGVPVRGFMQTQFQKIDSHPKLMMVIDACRTSGAEGNATRGPGASLPAASPALRIAPPDVNQPPGMLLALSTGLKQSASDSGEFAAILAEKLKTPGLNLASVFEEVKLATAKKTGNRQIPVYQSQITEALCLAGCSTAAGIDPMVALTNAMQNRPTGDTGQIAAAEQLTTSGKSLAGLDLTGLHFSRAKLSGADISRANLRLTDFDEAVLSNAHLSGAMMAFANLTGTKASGADATEARFYFSQADHADFSGIHAQRSNWEAASLRGASFRGADLQGASFLNADLREADFSGADLRGTFLIGAAVAGAHFDKAQLDDTDLSRAVGSADQFSAEQKLRLCATDFTALVYRYDIRTFDDKQPIGSKYQKFYDGWLPPRGGLKLLRACSTRTQQTAGSAPIYAVRNTEVITEELTLDLSPQLLASGGRADRVNDRVKSQLAAIQSEDATGHFVTVPSQRSLDLLAALRRNVDKAKLLSAPVFDSDATFLLRARFQPQSIPKELWESQAGSWAQRDADPPRNRGPARNVWEPFFPPDTRPHELNNAHVEIFKRWTLERVKQFPAKFVVHLKSQEVDSQMYNMRDAKFDHTHTDSESFTPLVGFIKENRVQSPPAAEGVDTKDLFRLADAVIHVRRPAESVVLKIPRSKAAATSAERPVVQAILEVTGARVFASGGAEQLVIDVNVTNLQAVYADGSMEPKGTAP